MPATVPASTDHLLAFVNRYRIRMKKIVSSAVATTLKGATTEKKKADDGSTSPATGRGPMQTTPPASLTVDDIVGGIFASQAALSRTCARPERDLQEAAEVRIGCVDGSLRIYGTGATAR